MIAINFSSFLFSSFSEAALAPEPLVSDIITEPKNHKEIVEQPTTSSLLSTALVPIHDKRWQFDGGRIKSNFGFLPTLRSNMTKEESRRIMEMKEERHRLKMEILQLEKEAVQNKIQNSNDDCHVKLIEEEISVLA